MSETATAAAPTKETAAASTSTATETKPVSATTETKPAETIETAKAESTETKTSSIISDAGKEPAKVDKDGKPIPEAKSVSEEAKKEGEQKPTVPEKYEIKAPEGVTLDQTVLEKFTPIAKELGLTNDQVQKLADFQADQITTAQAAQQQAFESFKETTKNDAITFFGPKLTEELPYVAKGRDQFADSEVMELLEATGLSSHKAFIRMFGKMGRSISEDKLVEGKTSVAEDTRTPGQIIYGKDKKN